jgi:hypothetical protein
VAEELFIPHQQTKKKKKKYTAGILTCAASDLYIGMIRSEDMISSQIFMLFECSHEEDHSNGFIIPIVVGKREEIKLKRERERAAKAFLSDLRCSYEMFVCSPGTADVFTMCNIVCAYVYFE